MALLFDFSSSTLETLPQRKDHMLLNKNAKSQINRMNYIRWKRVQARSGKNNPALSSNP